MKFFFKILFLYPMCLYAQKVTYEHPSILGAGFFINNFIKKTDHNIVNAVPGLGVTYLSSISKTLDWNINLNGCFTDHFDQNQIANQEKQLLLQTSTLLRFRMVTMQNWVQPYLSAGLGLTSYQEQYSGFLPTVAGIEFNYKNIFLIPSIQYHLPFSSNLNRYFQFNISIAGTVGIRKKKPLTVKSTSIIILDKDSDGDGIPDKEDNCPDVPGLLVFAGCPDSDQDGIEDKRDECPYLFGIVRFKGCPIPDTDKDGLNDEEDSCILIPGVISYHGCPVPDTDKDGINDVEDSCVNVPGLGLNNGCPGIKKEPALEMQKAAKKIFFEPASHRLLSASYPALNKVTAILKENPDLKLLIEGNTDNQGTAESNQILSENRAKVVLLYLKGNGINENRLKAIGYGQMKPIDNNDNAGGRANNRRVEMKLHY